MDVAQRVQSSKKVGGSSFARHMMLGLFLGVCAGLFFGEYCRPLNVVNMVYINLLQMAIFPYIIVSIVGGVGKLSRDIAKQVAIRAGVLIGIFWAVGLLVTLLMSLAFPEWESAAFFSASIVEIKEKMDLMSVYIPANPFSSMAAGAVPAVVLFSLAVGVALIVIEGKQPIIDQCMVLQKAFNSITMFFVRFMPIGIFAMTAYIAGTMSSEEFSRLQVYFLCYIMGTVLLTFWVMPIIVKLATPFRYTDIVGACRDMLITAFVTGNLFILIPMLIENTKSLFEKYEMPLTKNNEALLAVIVPILFTFPTVGKLAMVIFIPFAAWFSGVPFVFSDYPMVAVSGLASFFASANVAIPFMLDNFQLPADMFQLYLATGIVNARFSTLLGAMHLRAFALLFMCSSAGVIVLRWRRTAWYVFTTILIMIISIKVMFFALSYSMKDAYTMDKALTGMSMSFPRVEATVFEAVPEKWFSLPSLAQKGLLQRVRERGVLRVGYNESAFPFTFINEDGDLVGLDVEMAHLLARSLDVSLEFVPVDYETGVDLLERSVVDIIMCAIPVTSTFTDLVSFSDPYMDLTLALIVEDYRRDDFSSYTNLMQMEKLTIAVPYDTYFEELIKGAIPHAETVLIDSKKAFFNGEVRGVDAMLSSAEGGAAWTLLHPSYEVVVPKPLIAAQPIAYAMKRGDSDFHQYVNNFILLKQKDSTVRTLYDHWILGKGAVTTVRRWSVLENVILQKKVV